MLAFRIKTQRYLPPIVLLLLATASVGCSTEPEIESPKEPTTEPDRKIATPVEWHFDGFTEVRVYRLNWDTAQPNDTETIVLRDGSLHPTRLPKEGVKLTAAQIEKLRDAVCGEHPKFDALKCHMPHHGVLFLNEEGKIVGDISLCFMCRTDYSSPSGFARYWDYDALAALFEELEIPIHPGSKDS